jgi:hypothetical protein
MGHAVFVASTVAREWQQASLYRIQMMARRTRVRAQPRIGIHEDGRQSLALLSACSQTINLVLVALSDAVELEVWADGSLRRRSRFLRDTEARKYSDRLASRLLRRGYQKAAEIR